MPSDELTGVPFLFINAPFETEFLGYGGEPTSLLYALAPLVHDIKNGEVPKLNISDISVVSFRSGAELDFNALLNALEKSRPKLIGISSMSPSSQVARSIAQVVKRVSPDTVTIFGGPHEDEMIEGNHVMLDLVGLPSTLSRFITRSTALSHPHLVDFSVSGDGEFALSFLVREFAEQNCPPPGPFKDHIESLQHQIAGIRGVGEISFVNHGREVHSSLSGRKLELNDLPLMPRELLSESHSRSFSLFRERGKNLRTAQVMTRRGCPWTCSFCTEGSIDRLNRTFENVRREISLLRDLGYRAIFFDDSTFTDLAEATGTKRGREGIERRFFLGQLMDYLRREKWEWGCETRIDQVNEQVLREMKESGCTYIYFGIESVVDHLLRDMHKGQKKDRVKETLDLIEQLDLRIGLSLMFCAPNRKTNETVESVATFEETIDFFLQRVARGHIEIISTNIATYYPGSRMTREALQSRLKLDFLNPTPNRGYPWNRFEDGLGHHPPNVTRTFVTDIVKATGKKLNLYLLKGNIQATVDGRLYDSLVRRPLINLNHAVDSTGSTGCQLGMPLPIEKSKTPEPYDSTMQKGREVFSRQLRLREHEGSIVFARTAAEAVSIALSLTKCYSTDEPVSAVVVARDTKAIISPFQYTGDYGNPDGRAGDAAPYLLAPSFFSYESFPRRKSGIKIALAHSFEDDYELEFAITKEITRGKTVVLLPHVVPDTGRIVDIARLCSVIRKESEDAVIIIDGRVGALALPPGHTLTGCDFDFYIASGTESLGIPSCAVLVLGERRFPAPHSGGFSTTDHPILEGMFHPAFNVKPNVRDRFPMELVGNFVSVIKQLETSLGSEDIVGAINIHRRKLKASLHDLLRLKFTLSAWGSAAAGFSDFIASFRLEGLDQFGLAEYLWREQQVLSSYFCEPDLLRFSFDLSNTAEQLEEAVERIGRLSERFMLRHYEQEAVRNPDDTQGRDNMAALV